jgi:IclR family transcriptional regulator, KDG regulon repressor
MKQGESGAHAPAVDATLQILDLLLASDAPKGITDLSRELGLSKATAFRIVHTLADAEVLECDPAQGKYRLGRKLLQLGSAVLTRLDVPEIAMPYLEVLMRRFQEEIHLGVFVQGEVVYISKVEALQLQRMNSRVGLRAPAYCTSIGRALLAYQPEVVIDGVLREPILAYTPRTVTDPDGLRAILRAVVENGSATTYEEFEVGLNSVGAPVFNAPGSVIAGVSISGPAHRLNAAKVSQILPELVEATAAISAELGFSGTRPLAVHRRRSAL